MSAESRVCPRRRVLKTGSIAFNHGGSVIDCTVKNLSLTGAGLQLVSSIGIPDHFVLVIEGRVKHRCRVAWRGPDRIGVMFLDQQSVGQPFGRERRRADGPIP
jgi:hypothetical protein